MRKLWLAWVALLYLAGCASYDGRGLVPGQSRAGDVQAQMGAPSDRLTLPNGGTIWYYPRGPEGHATYAVRLSPEGVVQTVEQVLTTQNLAKLVPGATSAAQVRELLGPPSHVSPFERLQRNVWEYRMYNEVQSDYHLFVQLSYDGVVREVLFLKDYNNEPCGSGR